MPDLTLALELQQTDETELYLALEGAGLVKCRRCHQQVDLTQFCELARGSDGRIYVTACGVCVEDAPYRSVDRFVHELVDQLGAGVVLLALADLHLVPLHDSKWIWRSLQTTDRRLLTFDRVYADGRVLRFEDASGSVWTCTLRDWCGFLKNGQAEKRQ